MGKRDKKSSKGRLDKYYHLAKEQGYRARSAFKLIQLNQKYGFLEKSRVLIDLCAAPGGWLQVATKYMAPSSLIIGVDLAPIKPIPGVITFEDDITSDRCRQHLRQEMKTWKADVVLHDGAPNVGMAWSHDAYSQSELVLVSLKLATEFLIKGGTFVTKVFRSKDYNKLMWVFQQLFRKVESTKPASSRNVSAEIFVVCRDYVAPKKIDPQFLDPKAVFSEIESDKPHGITDILKPDKRKRNREGYEDGNYTLHKKADVMEFIQSEDAIVTLGTYNQLVFESDEAKALLKHEKTTTDIIANCEDLKVLGRSDFKLLLKWRKAIREEQGLEKKEEPKEAVVVEEEPQDEEEQLQKELENLTEEERRKRKREKRKANEKKMKQIHRMELNMIVPTDIGLEQEGNGDQGLFSIRSIAKDDTLEAIQSGDMSVADQLDEDNDDEFLSAGLSDDVRGRIAAMDARGDQEALDESDYEAELERQMDEEYERYIERKSLKNSKFRARLAHQQEDEWHGFDSKKKKLDDDTDSSDSDGDDDDDDEDDDDTDDDAESASDMESEESDVEYERPKKKAKSNSLLNDLGKKAALARPTASGLTTSTSMFFDQDIFKGIDGLDESDDEEDNEKGAKSQDDMDEDDNEQGQNVVYSMELDKEEDDDEDYEDEDENSQPSEPEEVWEGSEDENSIAVRKAIETGITTAEAMTLARQLANKEKTKQDLIDEGFTREAFRDKDGLPAWFIDEENKHNKPHIPVTKEAIRAMRERLKALDARPIKKIVEAKARKKSRALKRLEKARKKADAIVENEDMTEREKATTINRMLARATKSKPKKEVKLVVAKGINRGVKGRPKGVKGRYKMVDARMKKDLRAEKRLAKKKKKGRK